MIVTRLKRNLILTRYDKEIIEPRKRPLENVPIDPPQKRAKVDPPKHRTVKTNVSDKEVDEIAVDSLIADLIDLTFSSDNRPSKFSISLNDIKEIIRRFVKKPAPRICRPSLRFVSQHMS